MNILVVGATGPTGRQLVQQGIERGHNVTAIARNPEAAKLPEPTRVVQADVMRPDSLLPAVKQQDAVICCLGTKLSRKPTTMLSDGTRNLITAMREAGTSRLICVTGIGAGDSKGHGGFVYDRIIQPLLLNEIYKDKTRQEAVVRDSGLQWTLVRPAALTNGARTNHVKAFTDLQGITVGKISRADVAAFILSQLDDQASVKCTFTITG
jgi:putative NADH-flavin reductase